MYILLSYPIDENAPMYGGKKGFLSKDMSSISKGDSANTSNLNFPSHLGTHIDFPRHFYNEGQTLEDFNLDFWFFKSKEIQLLDVKLNENNLLIKPEDIKTLNYDRNAKLILLKTGFGKCRQEKKYWEKNPGLSIEIAEWIKKEFKNVKIVGIDSISVSSYQNRTEGRTVHKKLLDPKNPILLVEDMDLSGISTNTIFKRIWISPLMIKESDGCPCTIIADVE